MTTTTARGALSLLPARAGLARDEVSRRLGRSRQFMSSLIGQGSTPKADTLARVADVCGYTLALVPHGSTLPDGSIVLDGKDC